MKNWRKKMPRTRRNPSKKQNEMQKKINSVKYY